jgi:hypothetical protein
VDQEQEKTSTAGKERLWVLPVLHNLRSNNSFAHLSFSSCKFCGMVSGLGCCL